MHKASILPWCRVLYAVVDSRWPQKPGLCIDAAGAVGRPDGMGATYSGYSEDICRDGVTDRPWNKWSVAQTTMWAEFVGTIWTRCHSAFSAFNSAQVLSVMRDPDMFNASLICQLVYMCVIKRLQ